MEQPLAGLRDPYPDNSAIHAQKDAGRRERGAISFAEKLDALDALKARVEPIVRAREARKRAAAKPS
jgi:hypothetical protein